MCSSKKKKNTKKKLKCWTGGEGGIASAEVQNMAADCLSSYTVLTFMPHLP